MTDLVENGVSVAEGSAVGQDAEPDWKGLHQKLEQDLQKRNTENEILKARIAFLEQSREDSTDQAGASKVNKSQQQKDDFLTKAKELLFEKTKICKRQEQQIEALNNQIESIKEVMAVSKEMLEVRNMENTHFQEQFETLQTRLKGEREHHVITQKKLIISKRMYADLRKEHDLQVSIFKELRDNYKNKIDMLTKELEKYQKKGESTSSTENHVNGN